MLTRPGKIAANSLLKGNSLSNVDAFQEEMTTSPVPDLTSQMQLFLNASEDDMTSSVTSSLSTMEIVVVVLLLVISSVAILMNSGVLILTYG